MQTFLTVKASLKPLKCYVKLKNHIYHFVCLRTVPCYGECAFLCCDPVSFSHAKVFSKGAIKINIYKAILQMKEVAIALSSAI